MVTDGNYGFHAVLISYMVENLGGVRPTNPCWIVSIAILRDVAIISRAEISL